MSTPESNFNQRATANAVASSVLLSAAGEFDLMAEEAEKEWMSRSRVSISMQLDHDDYISRLRWAAKTLRSRADNAKNLARRALDSE